MNAAHEPSMDDILKSIRRIIRSDQDEAKQQEEQIQVVAQKEKPRKDDDNLIRMKIHDQKRLRILEKKLQTVEAEYEQKLQLHRRKMSDYRRQNQELSAAADAYRSKIELMAESLKTAHECLAKLQERNKVLKNKVLQMARLEDGTAVLKTIQREFANLDHPDQVKGDKFSRLVRHEVYNEFSEVLEGVESRFAARRMSS